MKTLVFSEGKAKTSGNEDAVGYNQRSWVVCDGSTDKYNRLYDGKHGGEIASQLVKEQSLQTSLNGKSLVEFLTNQLANIYHKICQEAIYDPQARFATTLVCARVHEGRLWVTQVGDTAFRINETDTYHNVSKVDILISQLRAQYIEQTDDVEGSREFIMPLLRAQLKYCNNAEHPLGYGDINGVMVPSSFIKTFEFPIVNIRKLEYSLMAILIYRPKQVLKLTRAYTRKLS